MAENFSLFGFEIRKKEKELESFVPPNTDDGSHVVTTTFGSHSYYALDIDNNSNIRNEADVIARYRELSGYSEIDVAIDEIVNEAIVYDDSQPVIQIDFSEEFTEKYSEKTKELFIKEFEQILRLLDFSVEGSDWFRRWYIDGRLPFHKIVDEKKLKEGIKELRWIDPIKVKKVTEIIKSKDKNGVEIVTGRNEFFIYNEKGFKNTEKQGIKIAKDSIAWVTSGLTEVNTGMVLSYLHKAIRPTNQLRMMEDATVIYRISRAPERRIFYIDTGDMPRTKAEEYIRQVMARYRNKQVYDAETGMVKDDKKHLSMLEDFWLPRSNGKGTEVSTLPGGTSLGQIEDIEYFKGKLYQALNVPTSRLQQGQSFSIGRSNEISRDEIKFSKFIDKLRKRFNSVFMDLLRTQLILKGIASAEEWEYVKEHIFFNYNRDNVYSELKDAEIQRERINLLQLMEPYVGKYFSQKFIKKNVLRMTDEEIENMAKDIKKEPKPEPIDGEPGAPLITPPVEPGTYDDEEDQKGKPQ